jgi:hypothetical protein
MPLLEPSDVWGFDFMGPFPPSNGYTHMLVEIDYVTKWVKDIPTRSANAATTIKMLKDIIFPRFGLPRYLMTDSVSHFLEGSLIKNSSKVWHHS